MTRILSLALAALAVLVTVAATARGPAAAPPPIALVDVHVLPMTGDARVLPRSTVIVRAGRIEAVGPVAEVAVPEGALVVEGRGGLWVLPGLVDAHVHAFDRAELDLYLANGITAVLNLHGIPRHLAWRDSVARGQLSGPRIFTAGPILDGDPPTRMTNRVLHAAEEARAVVAAQADSGYDAIKIYDNVGPELYEAIVEAARAAGRPVIGHVPTPVGLERILAGGGQDWIEHGEELSPFFGQGRDTTGLAAAMARLAELGVAWTPTIGVMTSAEAQAEDWQRLVSRDEMRYANPRTAQVWGWAVARPPQAHPGAAAHFRRLAEFGRLAARLFHEAGGLLVPGSDAPIPMLVPGFSLHDELAQLAAAGIPPYDVVRAATTGAARALGADSLGAVATGRLGDLLVLRADPTGDLAALRQIEGVVAGGRWLPADTLQARLDGHAARWAVERAAPAGSGTSSR